MPNTDIFSDLSQDDLIKIERLLENILINIDGIAGRKAILKNATNIKTKIFPLDDFDSTKYDCVSFMLERFGYKCSSQ